MPAPVVYAASCHETGLFRHVHGAYAKSGNPRCIGSSGGRSRLVDTSHDDLVSLRVMGNEFPSDVAFCCADDRTLSHALDGEANPRAELRHSKPKFLLVSR